MGAIAICGIEAPLPTTTTTTTTTTKENDNMTSKTNSTRKSSQRAIEIFAAGERFGVWELGGRGEFVDVINLHTGKVYRMGDRALNDALLHHGDTIEVEFHSPS